ncbi:MAG TPA: PTS sugar transporter subunit IIC, partial [bacterium]
GGLVYLDTDAVGQFMISQPLVSCTAAGAIFDNWQIGLTMGLLMQLPYLVEIPVGGAKIALGNLGAYVAAGMAAKSSQVFGGEHTNLVLALSVLYGVFVSLAAIPLQDILRRRVNRTLLMRADAAAEMGALEKISQLQYVGAGCAFVFGVLVCGLFAGVGSTMSRLLLPLSVEYVEGALFKPLLLGAGVGAVLWLFVKRNTLRHGFVGLGCGVIYILFHYLG